MEIYQLPSRISDGSLYTCRERLLERAMETNLLRQIRVLQMCVVALLISTALLIVNAVHPLLPRQKFKIIEAERVNIRERNGTLRAALSNSSGFNEGQRAERGGVTFSGLMFYNEEGEEEGGLVYSGKGLPSGGQNADVTLTMDQYRQDQNVYLHHEEHKDSLGFRIEDGLSINARPDWTGVKEEYKIYGELDQLSPEQRDDLRLKSLQEGKISSNRLFFGVKRGIKDNAPYDDTGIFIKNKWGRTAIKLYVDNDNKPHFEVYDPLGKTITYELKLPRS
jgi:hypothetical protein